MMKISNSMKKKLEKSNWYEKCKNRPWEKFGISKSLYYYRLANGIPLDKHRHKDKCAERYSGKEMKCLIIGVVITMENCERGQ